MNKIYRSTQLVLSAAFFIVFIGSVDTTYAQGNFDQFVSVPNNLPALTVAPEKPVEGETGITLDLSGVSSVDANAIAFGQRLVDPLKAEYYLKVFLETPFEGGRHQERVEKMGKTP